MILVRILKRKDAASLIVAVALGLAVGQFLTNFVTPIAFEVTDGGGTGLGWQTTYLQPAITLLLQLVVLEVLARLTVIVRGFVVAHRPR